MCNIEIPSTPRNSSRADACATAILCVLREAQRPAVNISLAELHSQFAAVVDETLLEAERDVRAEYSD